MLALATVLVLASACSSGDEEPTGEIERGIVEEPTPDPAAEADTEEQLTPVFEGEVVPRMSLAVGECFNDYVWRDRAANRQRATTRVECGRAHESQLYFKTDHPAPEDQPYIGEPELEAWARNICYRNFEEFVGMNYEESALEIGWIIPDLQQWGRDLSRDVGCYVFAWQGGLLRGSMEDIAL